MRSGRAAGVVDFRPRRAEEGCIDLHAAHAEHTMMVVSVQGHAGSYDRLPRPG